MENGYKIFCDESCHLPHDGSDIMVFGALFCPIDDVIRLNRAIKALRQTHHYHTEIKWTKLLARHWSFYQALLDLLLNEECLRFKATIVQNKHSLDHHRYNEGSHSNFYYKMAYYTLRDFLDVGNEYRVYLDYMDTLGAEKTHRLQTVLNNEMKKAARIEVFTIRSHESQLIQLCDVLIGAVAYSNRSDIPRASGIKNKMVQHLEGHFHRKLDQATPPWEEKFNLFKFSPQGAAC